MERKHDFLKLVIALAVALTCLAFLLGTGISEVRAEGQDAGALSMKSAAASPGDDIRAVPSCPFCGMDREKFAHSRVFIRYEDGSVLGACSIHCAAAGTAVTLDKSPLAIWVGDYKNKNLIDAEKAVWVLGGSKMGVMSKRAKWAFETQEDADQFIRAEGGEIVAFDKAMRAAYEDMYEDTKMIRERRAAKRMMHQHAKP